MRLGFCDPRVDALIEQAAVQAENPPAASVLWPRVEKAILDQAPVVPALNSLFPVLVSKRIGNYQLNPQWGQLYDQAWVR